METRKDNHLSERLEELLQAEETENLLSECDSEEAEELRLLLKTANDVTQYAGAIQPRREFVARMQASLGAACALKYDSRKAKKARLFEPLGRWAVSATVAALLAVLTSTGGFVLAEAASRDATAGDALYPVKLATEKLRATIAASETRKVYSPMQPEEIKTETIVEAVARDSVADVETVSGAFEDNVTTVVNIHQLPASVQRPSMPGEVGSVGDGSPGKSGLAPGQQPSIPGQHPSTPGEAKTGEADSPGKSELAPGQQPQTPGGTKKPEETGKSEQAPGQQPQTPGETKTGSEGNGRSEQAPEQQVSAPGQQPSPSSNTQTLGRGNSGK